MTAVLETTGTSRDMTTVGTQELVEKTLTEWMSTTIGTPATAWMPTTAETERWKHR